MGLDSVELQARAQAYQDEIYNLLDVLGRDEKTELIFKAHYTKQLVVKVKAGVEGASGNHSEKIVELKEKENIIKGKFTELIQEYFEKGVFAASEAPKIIPAINDKSSDFTDYIRLLHQLDKCLAADQKQQEIIGELDKHCLLVGQNPENYDYRTVIKSVPYLKLDNKLVEFVWLNVSGGIKKDDRGDLEFTTFKWGGKGNKTSLLIESEFTFTPKDGLGVEELNELINKDGSLNNEKLTEYKQDKENYEAIKALGITKENAQTYKDALKEIENQIGINPLTENG
ncbi:4428_t:CDS:2 [Entrophospora sp. SA101]|nr:4428_t:CDS:2 [Entrophospora sp. SA101]